MTTSGTFTFSPNSGECIKQAYARIGMRGVQLAQDHLNDALNEMNYLAVEWANKGPNLWTVDKVTVSLTQGTATYTLDASTIIILDAWISTSSPQNDRILTGISRSDYAAYPDKDQQGYPTVYWLDRTVAPTITLWPVPDGADTYTLNIYRYRQTQDAVMAGGLTPEVPYRWLDALIWGLAERLAFIHQPDRLQLIAPRAMLAYETAASQDTEYTPLSIGVDVSGYWS